jgi:hypothetical protein
MKLVLNFYGFLKMNKCEAVPYPEPQLINAGASTLQNQNYSSNTSVITQPLLHTFTKEYLSTVVFDKHEEPTIQID